MKSKILLLLGIISFVTACSQKRVLIQELTKAGGLFYSNSKPFTGVGFNVFSNNKLEREIEYKNGKLDGKSIIYHKNGKLDRLYTYKEGIRNGFSEYYRENSDLIQKGNFKDGKADGPWIIWLNYTEYNRIPIYVKATYKEGKRFGTSIYYTKDNNVIAKTNYDNGILIEGDYEDDILNREAYLQRLNTEKLAIENHLKEIEEYKKEDSLFKIIEKNHKITESGEILIDGVMKPYPIRKYLNAPVSIEIFKKQLKEEGEQKMHIVTNPL
jgi:hypothetical protein